MLLRVMYCDWHDPGLQQEVTDLEQLALEARQVVLQVQVLPQHHLDVADVGGVLAAQVCVHLSLRVRLNRQHLVSAALLALGIQSCLSTGQHVAEHLCLPSTCKRTNAIVRSQSEEPLRERIMSNACCPADGQSMHIPREVLHDLGPYKSHQKHLALAQWLERTFTTR